FLIEGIKLWLYLFRQALAVGVANNRAFVRLEVIPNRRKPFPTGLPHAVSHGFNCIQIGRSPVVVSHADAGFRRFFTAVAVAIGDGKHTFTLTLSLPGDDNRLAGVNSGNDDIRAVVKERIGN